MHVDPGTEVVGQLADMPIRRVVNSTKVKSPRQRVKSHTCHQICWFPTTSTARVLHRWRLTSYYCCYYNRFTALWILSRTTRVSCYQKGKTKTNMDFLEQETVIHIHDVETHETLCLSFECKNW